MTIIQGWLKFSLDLNPTSNGEQFVPLMKIMSKWLPVCVDSLAYRMFLWKPHLIYFFITKPRVHHSSWFSESFPKSNEIMVDIEEAANQIWIQDLSCLGDELSLDECYFQFLSNSTILNTPCHRSHNVQLHCPPADGDVS